MAKSLLSQTCNNNNEGNLSSFLAIVTGIFYFRVFKVFAAGIIASYLRCGVLV